MAHAAGAAAAGSASWACFTILDVGSTDALVCASGAVSRHSRVWSGVGSGVGGGVFGVDRSVAAWISSWVVGRGLVALTFAAGFARAALDVDTGVMAALSVDAYATFGAGHVGAWVSNALSILTLLASGAVDSRAGAALLWIANTLSVHALFCALALNFGTAWDALAFAAELV